MRFGAFVTPPTAWPPEKDVLPDRTLYGVALYWLREDREYRRVLEREGRKLRGPRRAQDVPTDSETFYKKCV
jgi:CCR4-NOT complex subunit CAF16